MRHYIQPTTAVVCLHGSIVMQGVLTGSFQEGSQEENRAPYRPFAHGE